MGGGYLRLKLLVRIVVDYAETRISNFVIEYRYLRKTISSCSCGARVEQIEVEYLVTLSL